MLSVPPNPPAWPTPPLTSEMLKPRKLMTEMAMKPPSTARKKMAKMG